MQENLKGRSPQVQTLLRDSFNWKVDTLSPAITLSKVTTDILFLLVSVRPLPSFPVGRKPAPVPVGASPLRGIGSGSGDLTPVQTLNWVEKIPSSVPGTCVSVYISLLLAGWWGECQRLLLVEKHMWVVVFFFFYTNQKKKCYFFQLNKSENPQKS